MSTRDTLTSFLSWLRHEKRYSPHTVQAYSRDLGQFGDYLERTFEQSLEQADLVKHIHIRSWMVSLMDSGQNESSVKRKISSLRTYWRFLKIRGLTEGDPLQKVILPKSRKRLPKFVESPALEQLFKLMRAQEEADSFSGLRDRTVLELLYGMGLRRSELIGLDCSDIDSRSGRLRVRGKGSKERDLPLRGRLSESVRQYEQARNLEFPHNPEGAFFLTDRGERLYPKFVYRLVRNCLSLVTTAEKRSPHVLRHSFATHMSDAGADLNAIKELLGHASLAATQVYTHTSISRLREVYRQAHPRADEE